MQGWGTFLRTRAQIVYKCRRNPVACRGNVEEQNKLLESAIIIINYRIIIIKAYYNYIIIAQYNYYISNKDLLEDYDREESVRAIGLLSLPV
jgi:heme/copper-type cytochrome/quinol oxidase subunit 2